MKAIASFRYFVLSLPANLISIQDTNGTIFINCRKNDRNWNALALYQELQKYFPKDQIFKDVNADSPGDDFVESVSSALQTCGVLLVLIGKNWLDIKTEYGERRLDDPHDFVRLEVAKALDRHIKVIPVLLDRMPMPKAEDLPENMQSLCRRQFVEIDPTRFEDDVRKLAEAIIKVMAANGPISGYRNLPVPDTQPQPQSQQAYQPQQQSVQAHQQQATGMPPMPDNNMVWGILTTIFCCLPLGIVSIISVNKVSGLYQAGKYTEAQAAAAEAKKYAIWAAIRGGIVAVIYVLIQAAGGGY